MIISVTTRTEQRLRTVFATAATLLLLSGCGALPDRDNTFARGDGAPRHTVNIANIPDAEPRIEARSRYGNPDSYVVRGQRYHVMNGSTAFQQRGVASWYGTKFHGRKTSSGEPYDMFAMSAAHKTLPLPTWVEVINQDNQKRIVVKVNDRGPFIDGRIIDLSYAAATKLGVIATGTANVSIRAIDPAQHLAQKNKRTPLTILAAPTTISAPPVPIAINPVAITGAPVATAAIPLAVTTQSAPLAKEPGSIDDKPLTISGFYLQVAAFSERSNAEQLRQRLLPLKPGDIQINPGQKFGQALYRVRIGPLSNLSEAGKIAAQLTSLGLSEPKIMLD